MAAPRFSHSVKVAPNVAGFTPSKLFKWAPHLALWGTAAVGAVTLIASAIPRFQTDVLMKLPVTSAYYNKLRDIPDSDKPF